MVHMLKNNVESELKKKIDSAQKLLQELKDAVQQVETNSAKVKEEVCQGAEEARKMIGNRKVELTRQIDFIRHNQICALNEEIEAVYLALGSLQTTLVNLDSFDSSQLMNLHIPGLPAHDKMNMGPMQLQFNSATLEEPMKQWGIVCSNQAVGLYDKENNLSFSPRYGKYQDSKSGEAANIHKATSVLKFPFYAKSTPDATTEGISNHQESRDIDRWLAGVKLQSCSDCDDFEIVSIEDSIKQKEPLEINIPIGNAVSEPPVKCGRVINPVVFEDSATDLSKWLKPRKKCSNKENSDPQEKQNNPAYIHNPMKNRFVDFPCLRTDHSSWIHCKRSKMSKPEISSSNGVFPPEYTLPAPFWLKKHC